MKPSFQSIFVVNIQLTYPFKSTTFVKYLVLKKLHFEMANVVSWAYKSKHNRENLYALQASLSGINFI